MSGRRPVFVVVGAGLAGAKAVEALREEGFDGRVVLLGAEGERPYERPPLSKGYLRGEEGREKLFVHEESFYEQNDVELRLDDPAVELDLDGREVRLQGGERLRFDRLLLATGAEPRRLSVPGAQLEGVHYLRSVESSNAIRARFEDGGGVVVIGAGWIGSEAAASARQKGLDVTVIEPGTVPLERVLGSEVGAVYRDLHREHGVELLLGTGVEAFEGASSVERVRTTDGRTVECDFAIVGIGVEPRTELARSAGLAVEDGIVVDAKLETSRPGVFAAGDVANHRHPIFGPLRVEHWAAALNHGPAAARNMLGRDEPYDGVPYFFSDQYDAGMEYAGHARQWDRVVFRGDPASREFVAFWLHGDRVVAGMNFNVWDVNESIQRLARDRARVYPAALTDVGVPLGELLGAEAA